MFIKSELWHLLTSFVEAQVFLIIIWYDNDGDNMKEDILIDDVIRKVDRILIHLEAYYTIKNINRKNS